MRLALPLLIALLAVCPLYAAKDADLFTAAKAALDKNENEKAAELLEQAIKLNPNKAEYHLTASLHEYDMALKLAPSFMPTHFRVGYLAAESNSNHARGEQSLKTYPAYQPKHEEPDLATAWYYLGKLYEGQGKKADAKQAYLKAQKIAPKSKDITEAIKRVS